jgi:hypothetical protein
MAAPTNTPLETDMNNTLPAPIVPMTAAELADAVANQVSPTGYWFYSTIDDKRIRPATESELYLYSLLRADRGTNIIRGFKFRNVGDDYIYIMP